MTVSAQIAICPLRQERLGPTVHAVSDALTARGLAPSVGPMSTLVTGELDALLDGLREAFRAGRGSGPRRDDRHTVQRLSGRLLIPVSWRIFERAAEGYEAWYATGRGRRVDEAERALLACLLAPFADARSVLDVGCGTGHFAAWLRRRALDVIGLDRSPAMLADLRRRHPEIPLVVGDAGCLPVRSGAVDVALLVTTLEFVERPEAALSEAVRVARQGLVLVVLNRWSLGGLSRRVGPQARRPILGAAKDTSLFGLRRMARAAAGDRLQALHWTSSLFPDGLWAARRRVPVGDVIGMAVVLSPPGRAGLP